LPFLTKAAKSGVRSALQGVIRAGIVPVNIFFDIETSLKFYCTGASNG
jgi:hypothetical protein